MVGIHRGVSLEQKLIVFGMRETFPVRILVLPIVAVCPQANFLSTLSLSFFIYTMRVKIPTFQGD